MSTIPFTLIEGAMALPRLRPLNHLPASFGSEWVLLPPNISFRRELRALYAAVLRTFCLSVEEMRSLCSWTSKQKMAMAASLDQASDAGMNGVDGGAADGMARTTVAVEADAVEADSAAVGSASAIAPAVVSAVATSIGVDKDEARPVGRGVQTPPPVIRPSPLQRAPGGAPFPLNMLAGGACAIGGAAVLAWLAFGHSAHRQTVVEQSAPEGVSKNGSLQDSEQSARQRSATAATPDTSTRHEVSGSVAGVRPSTRIAAAPPTSAQAPQTAAQETTPAAAQRRRPAMADTAPSSSVMSSPSLTLATQATATSHAGSDAQYSTRAATHRDTSQALAQTDAQAASDPAYAHYHHSPSRALNTASQSASPLAANRPAARPSVAGTYSPLAPSMLGNDEYASVTMSAGTHLRGMASSPRAGAETAASIDTNSTEWINRMSQRRVTDIPDQFSK